MVITNKNYLVVEAHEKAYAKINLSLRVIGRKPNGYHELSTAMQSVTLHDDVSVRVALRAPTESRSVRFAPRRSESGATGRKDNGATGQMEGGYIGQIESGSTGAGLRLINVRISLAVRPRSSNAPPGARNTAYLAAAEYMRHIARDGAEADGVCDGAGSNDTHDGAGAHAAAERLRHASCDGAGAHAAAERQMCEAEVGIRIRKRIPVAAGLAGGSADAAAVLRALDRAFRSLQEKSAAMQPQPPPPPPPLPLPHPQPLLPLSLPTQEELRMMAARIGADVPFCLRGGAALARGVGDLLTPCEPLPQDVCIVLVNPRVAVSTSRAFQAWDALQAGHWAGSDADAVGEPVNDLERAAALVCPKAKVGEIKRELLAQGAYAARMTGSGPTVFGLFSSESKARAAHARAAKAGLWAALCRAMR